MMLRLESKIALVTGGASGLGKSIARRLAADGAHVIITDIRSGQGQATAAECDFVFFAHDVSDESQWTQVMEEVERRCGRVDILVNNAGILGPTDSVNPENSRLADWKSIFAVNVEGVFLGCRSAIPAMRKAGGGSIINISSVAGLLATPYATAYGASKAAVRQLTKSVAQYCAQEKLRIRCNSIHPGIVRTPAWDAQAKEIAHSRGVSLNDILALGKAIIPLGEFVSAEEVASLVSYLASDEARHMTGAKVILDGGIVDCDSYHHESRDGTSNALEAAECQREAP